jgi:phosphoenolpyruvate-protein kinase (PTS system EI component)
VLPSHLLLSQHFRLAGILTEVGAETGHAAILARSLGIPVLAGLPGILGEVRTGDVVALDGHEGHVHINPDFEVEAAYQRLQSGGRGPRGPRPPTPPDVLAYPAVPFNRSTSHTGE